MNRTKWRLGLAVVTTIAGITTQPTAGLSQPLVRISGGDPCANCEVTFVPVATLGGPTDPASPVGNFTGQVVRRQSGQFYVTATGHTEILVYAPTGEFIRVLGRSGSGPGEFSMIRSLTVMPGDSLAVIGMERRLTVFTPDDSVARVARVPIVPDRGVVLRPDGRMLVSTIVRVPRERRGFPIHAIDSDGGVSASFGIANPAMDSTRPSMNMRFIAPARAGGVWSSRMDRYTIERLDDNGTVLEVLDREVDWFPKRDFERAPRDERPSPYVRAIAENDTGQIIVMISVADANWRPDPIRRQPNTPLTPDIRNDERDTIIEVLDPRSGRLVAAVRFDELLEGFASPDHVYTFGESTDGDTRVRIWRLAIRS